LVLLAVWTSNINVVVAQDVVPPTMHKPGCSETDMYKLVTCYANKYKVPLPLAHYIVKNESHYNPNNVGDKNILCKRTGQATYARGLMQITRCWHPNVSDKQAFDPNFNLNYGMKLASNKATCMSQFTTCRNYYNK